MSEYELVELGEVTEETKGTPETLIPDGAPQDQYPNVFLPR